MVSQIETIQSAAYVIVHLRTGSGRLINERTRLINVIAIQRMRRRTIVEKAVFDMSIFTEDIQLSSSDPDQTNLFEKQMWKSCAIEAIKLLL